MKIGILGTRGIPNHYGGFEQWAEHLSKGLVKRGCEVTVYNSHNHPFQDTKWNGVHIIHQYDPEYIIGTSGQFVYDLNCILDARKRNFDIILQLGFTSSAVWGWLLPGKKSIIFTNMDGHEWIRDKFSKNVKLFLKHSEKWAVRTSHFLIADSPVIRDYYVSNYNKPVFYIPYGTSLFVNNKASMISDFHVKPFEYKLLIARLEPENNIETIIKGVVESNSDEPLLVIGDYRIPHGKYLFEKYSNEPKIRFLGGIYDFELLNNLRYYSGLYFHGHSVGGTNPSLLEAMACSAIICAHNNVYNRSVLANSGYFFDSQEDIVDFINAKEKVNRLELINKNTKRIKDEFLLEVVIQQHFDLFKSKLH